MEFQHYSVLENEVIEALAVKAGGVYVDGTLGGAGHARRICELGGRLIGIDRDMDAINVAKERLERYGASIVYGNFSGIGLVLDDLNIAAIDGAILDLGVSSYQLDNPERGFSYRADNALDMRMDNAKGKTAADIVNGYEASELARILAEYGEEKYANSIARKIVQRRPIHTTFELVDVIKSAIPPKVRFADKHPAKRTFQAIRIEVNDELGSLRMAIEAFAKRLAENGRLAIITFHSLEDRIVKTEFERLVGGECSCPKGLPVCVCGAGDGGYRVVTRKPIVPSERELGENSRSKSAKLRVLERVVV